MDEQNKNEADRSIHVDEDTWIFDTLSLNYKRQSDQQENPHLKLQKILNHLPSPSSIHLNDSTVMKALISMRTFLKKNVVEAGKVFDGDIPEPVHHHWMDMEIAFENLDMDLNLGRDPTANLKVFLDVVKKINEDFLRMQY